MQTDLFEIIWESFGYAPGPCHDVPKLLQQDITLGIIALASL